MEIFAKSLSRLSAVSKLIGESDTAFTAQGLLRAKDEVQDNPALINSLFDAYARSISDNIYIHEGVGDIDAKKIRTETENFIKEHQKTPVVIIDYIQKLAPYENRILTDKQNMDKSVLELKRLARDLDAVVIGISALNRMSYNDPMTMAAFKESGSIEYSADVLIGLQMAGVGTGKFDVETAKTDNPRKIEVKIMKNRNGPIVPSYLMYYYPADNLFMETSGMSNTTPLAQLFEFPQQELPFPD